MPKFEIYTEEKVARTYIVTAATEKEARTKFMNGIYDSESPSEALDVEVVDVVEMAES